MKIGIIDFPQAVSPPPGPPSTVPIAKGGLYSSTNSSSYTFSAKDLGTPHAKRIVIVALNKKNANSVSLAVGGVSMTYITGTTWADNNAENARIYYAAVPDGATGDITATFSGTEAEFNGFYWIAYPDSEAPIDADVDNDQGAPSQGVSASLTCAASGFAVGAGWSPSGSPSGGWSGTGTFAQSSVQSGDNNGRGYTVSGTAASGSFSQNSGSGNKDAIVAASWGPTT